MAKTNMERILADHMAREEDRFDQLAEDVKVIKNNHLFHMEKDIANIHVKMASFGVDISWVKWGIILLLSAFTTGAIALIFKLK